MVYMLFTYTNGSPREKGPRYSCCVSPLKILTGRVPSNSQTKKNVCVGFFFMFYSTQKIDWVNCLVAGCWVSGYWVLAGLVPGYQDIGISGDIWMATSEDVRPYILHGKPTFRPCARRKLSMQYEDTGY